MLKQLKMPFDNELKRDPKCKDCGLCKTAEYVCLLGQGPTPCDIMIVGEAPGHREDDSGTPFVGRAGELLEGLLKDVGISRKDVYITNAVHCRPPDNRTPKKKEIEACKRWLEAEIAAVKPKYVLILGNVPLYALLGQKGIRKARGMPVEKDGVVYFPTYHPAYALRMERQRPVLASDLKVFAKIVEKGGIGKEEGLNYRVVSSWEDVEEAIRDIKTTKLLSMDTETTGLRQFDPAFRVVSLGIATRTTQWCFPLHHPKGWMYENEWRQKRLIRMLDRALRGKTLVMHSGKFDTLGMAVVHKVWWYCDFDTMLAHYNLDENSPHDLGLLAQIYFDAIDYDIPLEEKHGDGPLDRHCQYLALDIYYTRKLYFKLKKQLDEDELTRQVFEWVTMPVARMYTDIEHRGFYINRKQLQTARAKYLEQETNSLAKLNSLVPDNRTWKHKKSKTIRTGVNWGSPDQLAEVLFRRLGMKPLDMTPKGKPSTSESVLLRLAKDQSEGGVVAKTVLEWREATKNLNTFIDAWDRIAVNSRIHPNFKVHGTTTGRPSCEEPNLQQTPRNVIIRSIIDAPLGWVLLEADQSQVEMRVATELSQDPVLKMIYQTGGDVHTKTVQDIFGIQNPDKEQRKKGKAINFGFLFGMWWKKFIIYARDNYDVEFTPQEAQEIRERFFRVYAGLPTWHKKQKRFANLNGYVRNLIGRKRRLPAAMNRDDTPECREAERQAINSPVQSFASDVTLMGAVAIHGDYTNRPDHPKHVKGLISRSTYRIVGTIHDALLGECKKGHEKPTLAKIKKIMSWPPGLDRFKVQMSVPLVAEASIGPWGKGVPA